MIDYGDLYRLEHSTHQTTKEILAKAQAERELLRDEIVKWRRWADAIIGGPGLLQADKEQRDEIDRKIARIHGMTPTHPIRRFIPTHIFTLHDDVRVPVRIGLMRGWCASGTDENGASWSIPDGQMADANGLKLSWQCSERGVSSVKAVEELR